VRAVKVPTIAIAGGASPAEMRNAVRAVADALRNGQRWTLEGQTHEVSAETRTAQAALLSGHRDGC
jgi:hypothetical protein